MTLRCQTGRRHEPVEVERHAKSGVDEDVERGVNLLWSLVGCGLEPARDDSLQGSGDVVDREIVSP
jgi:hypothetical protein